MLTGSDKPSFDVVMSIHQDTCFFINIYVTGLRLSCNVEVLASKVKHKLNTLKTQDSKKYGGCELAIVAGTEFGQTVL